MSNKRIKKKQAKQNNQQYWKQSATLNSSANPTDKHDMQRLKQLQEQQMREIYAKAAQQTLQITDPTKSTTKTYNSFNKETLRTYLKSPQQNSSNLIQLSRFLRRYCRSYDRLIGYMASMIQTQYYQITPNYDPLEQTQDDDGIIQSYVDTCIEMRRLNLPSQTFAIISELWTVGAVYCYKYQDDDTTLWFILDPEYCKISSQNYDGSLNCLFDFSYFKKNSSYLDYWASEFKQKYDQYDKDTSLRWQELDPEYTLVLKTGMNDLSLVIPPFVTLFEQIIDLVDLQGLTSQRDQLDNYKLVYGVLDTLSNATGPDEWSVDPLTAIPYFNRMRIEGLPDGISSAIVPFKLDTISFRDDETAENNKINNAIKNLFKSSGASQILDSTEISGTQGFLAATICDEMLATNEILPVLEQIINRHIEYNVSDHSRVKFIQVSPYTKSTVIDQYMKGAQYSMPLKFAVGSLFGQDPLDVMANSYFENKLMKLHEDLVPLSSSFTISSTAVAEGKTDETTGGRPQETDITADGEESRNRDR